MRLDSYPSVVVDFDDFNSSTDLKNAILRIRYNGGSRNTAAALKRAREKSFSYCHGARDGVTKIVILSTDGQSKNPNDTAIEAQKLKSINDVLVISIGLGSSYDKVELETIATYPEVVFEVVDYDKLLSVVYNYTETICRMNN